MADTDEKFTRSLSLPGDLRQDLSTYAAEHGISMSALARQIVEEYAAGQFTPENTENERRITRTSVWMSPKKWAKFTARTEKEGLSTQQVMRSWLRQNR